MSGSGPIYEYQRELTAKLEQALRERDEARAALKLLWEEANDESRCPNVHLSEPCRKLVNEALTESEEM